MLPSLLVLALFAPLALCQRDFHIDYNANTFVRDGKPYRYISGSVHYFRTRPEQWNDRLKMVRAAGLNAIQTYIPWNFHNTYQGKYDFSGDRNLTQFVQLAAANGLSVLLRPGPYICAEWENGGLPYWLLKYPNITLRSSQTDFMRESLAWWDVLMPIIKPLMWNNGGPVIMVQIENEYGTYGDVSHCDKVYLNGLRDNAKQHLGQDAVLYTTDPPENIACGKIDGVFATVDFGERGLALGEEYFQVQKKSNPTGNGGPRVNSEYYPGWYVTWGDKGPYKHFTTSEVHGMTSFLWNQNASFNYYMFHGGTNFGFWNGAEYAGGITTSYDYWAPMSENGVNTPKYDTIRTFIGSLQGWDTPPQTLPTLTAPVSSKSIPLGKYGNIFDYFPTVLNQSRCQQGRHTFEDLDQAFGYVSYSFNVTKSFKTIDAVGLHDFGFTYVDKVFKGTLSPYFKPKKVVKLAVNAVAGQNVNIVTESQGRLTWLTAKDPKGLTENMMLDNAKLDDRSLLSCPLDIDNLPINILQKPKIAQTFTPGDVYVGQFQLTRIGDTHLDVSQWGRGVVWINGFNIGKYWSSEGPQKSLYIPAPLLKTTNEIVFIELGETVSDLSSKHSVLHIRPRHSTNSLLNMKNKANVIKFYVNSLAISIGYDVS